MKIDLHCHSKYSQDTYLEPEAVIQEAVLRGLNGVCFTEHHSLAASLPVEALAVPEDFCVLRGMEVSTTHGHLLVYGLRDDSWNVWSRNQYLNVEAVIARVHRFGGICVPAHPFRGYDSLGNAVYALDGLDAIETHNGKNLQHETRQALQAAAKRNLPSIGGSDCHTREHVGRAYTEFENTVRTIEHLIFEIRNGNCVGRYLKND
jgi:predicted metal-dependent phosphoesterase TrpH